MESDNSWAGEILLSKTIDCNVFYYYYTSSNDPPVPIDSYILVSMGDDDDDRPFFFFCDMIFLPFLPFELFMMTLSTSMSTNVTQNRQMHRPSARRRAQPTTHHNGRFYMHGPSLRVLHSATR